MYKKERRLGGPQYYIVAPNGWAICIVGTEGEADVLLSHLNEWSKSFFTSSRVPV